MWLKYGTGILLNSGPTTLWTEKIDNLIKVYLSFRVSFTKWTKGDFEIEDQICLGSTS